MDGGRDKARGEEHGPLEFNNSPAQRDGDSAEIAQEELSSPGRDLWRRGLVLDSPSTTPEDTGDDQLRRNASLTSSPLAKRVNFSPMSSPRIGQRGASLSPSSSSSRNKPNSLKNLIPKLSFKNRNSNSNNVDIEKAEDLAFASSPSSGHGRYRPAWTLTNILTPRLKKTESLPVTPIAHSNPESTHGRYVVDPVTSMKKGPPLPIHRSRSVPAFNKDGSLRQTGVFRVIPTPNMTPARNITNLNDVSVVDGGEDVPEEEAVCRICMVELGEDSDAFKMECMCRGELALAHKECTIKWFTIKGNRTCDVCKQEVQNLPVTLLRMQSSQGHLGAADTEASNYSVWQDVPILVIVSMLAYFCFLEQLLLTKMKSGAIAISLPFSCVLGLLASMTSTTMVKKQYVWIYATIQFGLVVFFSHVFFSLVHMQPAVSILLATLVGFGLTMSGTTGLVEFSKWRRRHRTAEATSSGQVDPPPIQTTDQSMSGS
uniref:RING-CH-type domain-containing protein n=1 Tax=Noccaea caerulescens TaxID=107243 RepID=A0A1J3E9C6_NOCCA